MNPNLGIYGTQENLKNLSNENGYQGQWEIELNWAWKIDKM